MAAHHKPVIMSSCSTNKLLADRNNFQAMYKHTSSLCCVTRYFTTSHQPICFHGSQSLVSGVCIILCVSNGTNELLAFGAIGVQIYIQMTGDRYIHTRYRPSTQHARPPTCTYNKQKKKWCFFSCREDTAECLLYVFVAFCLDRIVLTCSIYFINVRFEEFFKTHPSGNYYVR